MIRYSSCNNPFIRSSLFKQYPTKSGKADGTETDQNLNQKVRKIRMIHLFAVGQILLNTTGNLYLTNNQ